MVKNASLYYKLERLEIMTRAGGSTILCLHLIYLKTSFFFKKEVVAMLSIKNIM